MSELQYNLDFLNDATPVDNNTLLARRGDLCWGVNNSSFSDYAAEVEFMNYPGGLRQILERHIGYSEDNTGLDLAGGSNGRALSDLIDDGILGKGLVTNLSDLQDIFPLADAAIDHVSGDLATEQVWHEIAAWQQTHAPDGINLIMHRPHAGLQDQPAKVYIRAAHQLLDMLCPGGILFSQVPYPLLDASTSRAAYREFYSSPDIDSLILGRHSDDREPFKNYIAIVKSNTVTAP